ERDPGALVRLPAPAQGTESRAWPGRLEGDGGEQRAVRRVDVERHCAHAVLELSVRERDEERVAASEVDGPVAANGIDELQASDSRSSEAAHGPLSDRYPARACGKGLHPNHRRCREAGRVAGAAGAASPRGKD